ncbi:Putative phospholipase D-like protein [Orpheovirus IHUMI-LCC2]|uniref:Phospholipase D-like protein n=1 Tax=Orpheovirus IHUMI-LCC2 TaxID=2023057 RepID=A0A2I2L5B7_9VIRU|nr:Putative phospholipase D-like protein [Orpheovirus IHUMI-LCC2]SNW62700.1 Putative phospholipase D-like protein [Orpheovirus IHUMI-LCC2]
MQDIKMTSPISPNVVIYVIDGIGSPNPSPGFLDGSTITTPNPFKNMQEVVTYHNNNNLLDRDVQIYVLDNFIDNTLTINFPFTMSASLIPGAEALFGKYVDWNINGSLYLELNNAPLQSSVYINYSVNVIVSGSIVPSNENNINIIIQRSSIIDESVERGDDDYGIAIPSGVEFTLSNIITNKPIKVEGILNIIDGEAKLYNNSEAAIEIESTGKVNISNEKIEYFNRLQDSALFEGSGSLDSERSKYISGAPFVLHRTASNNIFHNFDILDVPNGTVDDNVSGTKIRYDNVILIKETKSLANKDKANYVFTTSEGELLTSKPSNGDNKTLSISNQEAYSYVLDNNNGYNVLNFSNIGKLNLQFDKLDSTQNVIINLKNVKRIKIMGYISRNAKESLIHNQSTSLRYVVNSMMWDIVVY